MKDIIFTAWYGDTEKEVNISAPSGSGAGGLHLYIDKFYKGVFLKRNGRWEWVPQDKSKDELTMDDIDVLISKIKENT